VGGALDDRQEERLEAYCRGILEGGDLDAKLAPAPDLPAQAFAAPATPVGIDRPTRSPELALRGSAPRLPRPGQLDAPEARRTCLARFAHHELMAVEYFAWALLRWPLLPAALRRGFFGALCDEQRHCRLYLDRLADHGARLEADDCSDYFWRHAPAIVAAPDPPAAFVAGMGLTLEQANLDFTLLYRDGFREAGDEASARVCQTVHDDEIRHVALAVHWLPRLRARAAGRDSESAGRPSLLDAYEASVPFPLAASRAKGRRFDAGARRAAGLDPAFIEHVRQARSSQQTARAHGDDEAR